MLWGFGGARQCEHNRGNKQVKPYSVDDFASAMIELGLYED
jgi:hypothetical protein